MKMPKPRIDYEATRLFIMVMMYEAFVSDQRMAFNIARVQGQPYGTAADRETEQHEVAIGPGR